MDEKSLSKQQCLQHYESIMPNFFYKEQQSFLGLHLVLVTLHGCFKIIIEQTNRIGDTKDNIQFRLVQTPICAIVYGEVCS